MVKLIYRNWVRLFAGYCLMSSCFVGCGSEPHEPPISDIAWREYDQTTVDESIKAGNCVFVYMHSELNALSPVTQSKITASQLRKYCGSDKYATYVFMYDDWSSSEIRKIARTVGFSKEPFLVFYAADGSAKFVDPKILLIED